MKYQDLKKDHVPLVHMVSTYQYIFRDTCRLYHIRDKSDFSGMFRGGYVFVDYVSGFMIIKLAKNSTENFMRGRLTFKE